MATRQLISLLIFLNVVFSGFGQEVTEQKQQTKEHYSFDPDSLLLHVKTLSSDAFEGRRTGTKGAQKARDYIIKRFKLYSVQPLSNSYEQPFPFKRGGRNFAGTNILGYFEGSTHPKDYIVISAHYDHEGIKNENIYNGADDNASGISALLSFADYLQKNTPQYSIILAAFDAEELGLEGAKYFISNAIVPLERIKLNINMDMISRNAKNQLYVVGTAYNDQLKSVITNVSGINELNLSMGHDGKDGLQNWTHSGDHGPFHLKNIPFLYFGVEDHKDYHKPTDDFENINPEFYKSAVQTILNVFSHLDKLNL